MDAKLTQQELADLVRSVFSPTDQDKHLVFLVDLPDEKVEDTPEWQLRREMVVEWAKSLQQVKDDLGFELVDLAAYNNVHNNNADLPENVYLIEDISAAAEPGGSITAVKTTELLDQCQIVIAPTRFSATAPLKLLAAKHNFRAATMPGFESSMMSALKIDYEEVNRRVNLIKDELDPAVGMEIKFTLNNGDVHEVYFDLRFRSAHASGGRFPTMGTAGNLPSGEAYIVPYEGEQSEKSLTKGILPVQFGDEVVLYRLEANKAVEVVSSGSQSESEAVRIKEEPAYANIAELGFGVLSDFGMNPVGVILLDEKLGLHIAFGRSDHFGGAIGVKDFSSPEKVVHIDRIYIPETQNKVKADYVRLILSDGTAKNLMTNGVYEVF